MEADWLDNDDDLVTALAVHEQQETKDYGETRRTQPGVADEACEGFDCSTGHNWIYPTNMPLRSYQQTIVQSALYKNTLVVLPTGLGKTFIAAVVMYNFYRWYPQGKVVFMAPTRPLVAQQINASQKLMPFAAADTVQLTGQLPKPKRAELWKTKRVFFVTPQVVHSDMLDAEGTGALFPFNSVKLLVVDEAHRAKGRYAYTQVADCLMAHNRNFRMLALSATPGRTMEDVATVCQNLYIANLQVRWDTSIDVQPYIHRRTIRTVVVSLKDRIKEPRERLVQIIEPYLRQLIEADIIKGNRGNMSKNALLYEQKAFLDRSAKNQQHPEHNIIMGNFAMCVSMYHSLDLMERHGLRVFVNNFNADEEGREKFVLARDRDLRDLVEQVRQELGANPLDYTTNAMTNGEVPPLPADLDFGHAKYEKLRQLLVQHFESNADSRAIVFCEYRESVMLIQRLLLQHRPLLRPRCFVGQGNTVGSSYALTQKQQLQIMADFRSGTSNVLVATSIGEEGIDVGEVELIVCFDICSSNPTRFVQRIGRTGRRKNGEVVMLVTEGREQQVLKDVLANKDQINRRLLNSSVVQMSLYVDNPRMVPSQFQPKCEEKHMEAVEVEEKAKPSAKKKEPRKRKEPAVKSDTLKKFFKASAPSESQVGILQGLQPYQMSEASQQRVKEQVARRSVKLKNIFMESQAILPSSSSQEDVQRLRKLTRLLQSSKPIISESQDLVSHLQDEHLPRPLKLYMLQSNPEFVKETHTKMLLQSQLDIDDNRLNSRQQRTRNNYKLLLEVCGGPDKLEELLQAEDQSLAEITLKDVETPEDERREKKFMATCDKIFEGLDEQGLNSDNFELKQQLLEQLDLRNLEVTVKEQLGGEETSWEQDSDEEEEQEQESHDEWDDPVEVKCDSMYMSQRMDFAASHAVQHSSTPLRVKPLCKLMFEILPEDQENEDGDSKMDVSDLVDNLSRLNCLMSSSLTKTPAQPEAKPNVFLESEIFPLSEEEKSPVKIEPTSHPKSVEATPDDLEIDLNDFLEPMDEEVELITQQKRDEDEFKDFLEPMAEEVELMSQQKQDKNSSQPKDPVVKEEIVDEFQDFLQPMSEELLLISQQKRDSLSPNSETKEIKTEMKPSSPTSRKGSPDIFATDSLSPWKPQGKSLASKLAAKTIFKPTPCTPPNTLSSLQSPEGRKRTNPLSQEKSPSIFDLYLNRMRGRGRLAKAAESLHRMTSTITSTTLGKEEEDSPIIRRPSKRKIIVSSDEEEDPKAVSLVADYNSDDCEQIPATQMPGTPTPPARPRRKRSKFNSFIVQEAEQSGSDHEEEAETTIGTYLKDSVIVSSDDEDHNGTDIQAMYLQAVRSPIQRPGAFKMPATRAYRDDSLIFSQPVEDDASQYLPCSFIVDDDSSAMEGGHDVSECPLEKAERILKERRRQRRLGLEPPAPVNKRRRVQTLSTSSDEDDVVFVK
ncbi:hypothetical protein KR009_007167 [Drosophila setifemur]|nr:hypothetical protein KR009_007167 [Drosophila setifemur]